MDMYAKNADLVARSWCGMLILPGDYYLLEQSEGSKWAKNSQVIADVGNGTLVIARSSSGDEDISDVSEALDFLGGKPPTDEDGHPITSPTFGSTQGLTTVWQGYMYDALPGSMNIYDVPVTSQIKMSGGWFQLLSDNATLGDYIEFSIVDKDDVLGMFSLLGLTLGVDILEVKKFVRTEFINPLDLTRQDFSSSSATTVMPGLYMRVQYMNVGTNVVKFKITEKYYEV